MMGIQYQSTGLGVGNSAPRSRHIEGAINGNIGATAAQDLRRQNDVPFNQAPHGVEFDGAITKLVISNATTNDYTIEILVNNTVVGSATRTNNNRVETFPFNIPVVENSQIRLRFAGGVGATQRPAAQLTYEEQ